MTIPRLGKRDRRVRGFIFTSAVFFMLFAALPALAIEYGGSGGRPAYPRPDNPRTESIFIHTIEPGQLQEEGVVVMNNTAEAKTLMVYAADSTPSTGGAFACKQFVEPKTDVGAWISLEKQEVFLESRANEVVGFTIAVPEDASIGEHNGCILIQEKKEKVEEQAGVSLSVRTGLRVAVTIPGEIKRKLEIVGFVVTQREDGSVVLQPQIKNEGNVSIDADVSTTTRYFFGTTYSIQGGQFPILRGETSDLNFELPKLFWGGWYDARLVVEYDENPDAGVGVKSGMAMTRIESPTVRFFSFPTAAGLAIEVSVLLLLVALVLIPAFFLKRKRWIKDKWKEYQVQSEEDITMLAKRFNVSWKLLAKVNKLKAPYTLQAGKEILVPPEEEPTKK